MRQRCGAPERAFNTRAVTAVGQHIVPFASEHHAGRAAALRRLELAFGIEADVAQHQRQLILDADAVVGILDKQRAVQAKANLRRRHHVRVIPVERRVADHEVVIERLALVHRRLRNVGHAVHLDRHPHAVPMHRGGLVEFVREMDDQPVADFGLDEGTRQTAVIGPRLDRLARRHCDVGELRDELHFDNIGIGVEIGQLVELHAVGPTLWRILREGSDREEDTDK